MCDHCVIDTVKQKMLDRRGVLSAAVAVGAAGSLGALSQKAKAGKREGHRRHKHGRHSDALDMTHELHPDFPTFSGSPQFSITPLATYAQQKYNVNSWSVNEHTGTHLDAPLHFSSDGQSVAEVPVDRLVTPLVVIDIRERAAADPDTRLTPDDINQWRDRHGELPRGCCVAMLSGWDRHVNSATFRNADDAGTMHFPGFHLEACQMLIEDGSAVGLAVDTLSLDHGPSPDFACHYAWLPTNRWGLECVANLADLPEDGATLVVGAPKVRGGSGGPSRAIALYKDH
ncbi:MAG: cyclase family protein [Pseudomonadota bacterium]